MTTSMGLKFKRGGVAFVAPAIVGVFLLMFIVSLVVASEAFQPQINQSNATDVDVSANISPVAVLMVPVTFVDVGEAKVAAGELTTRDFLTYVSTNNQTGYVLSVNMKTTQQCLRRPENQATVCTSILERNRVMQLASTTSTSSFPLNFWGLSVDELFESYSPVPATAATSWKIKATTSSAIDDETTIRVGVRADLTKAPGVYSNDIVISAVVNPLPLPIITAIDPKPTSGTQTAYAYGWPGEEIQMTGVYLDLLSRVEIGGNACNNLTKVSETFATCDVPDGKGPNLPVMSVSLFGGTNTSAARFGYPEEFKFTIDTRMANTPFAEGDTIDNNPTHFSGTATSFTIPLDGCDSWGTDQWSSIICSNTGGARPGFNWVVNWGDGSEQVYNQASVNYSSGFSNLVHDYGTPGEYQITITSNGQGNDRWFKRFGFFSDGTGSNIQSNKDMIKSIDSPFSRWMRGTVTRSFAYMFYGARNAYSLSPNLFEGVAIVGSEAFLQTFSSYAYNNTSGTLPAGLFTSLDTAGTVTYSGMFQATFSSYAYSSIAGTIPEGFFSMINTAGNANLTNMFASTFSGCMRNSVNGVIPSGIFSGIDASSAANLSGIFGNTFSNYAYGSLTGSIPAGLFSSLNITNATNVAGMFQGAFYNYAYNSTMGNIPEGLFSAISTANAASTSSMFYNTFYGYAYNSTIGTIPIGLFDTIDTYKATTVMYMYRSTFQNYAYNSTIGTIPNNLFNSLNLSSASTSNVAYLLNNTFSGYAYANNVPTTDINSIWGSANFDGKVTAANASTVMGSTFQNMRSLTGVAQAFINNYLGGIIPSNSGGAVTFRGTQVTDLASLHTNWK